MKEMNEDIKRGPMNYTTREEVLRDLIRQFEIAPGAVNENTATDWEVYNDNYAGLYFDEEGNIVICTVGIDTIDVSKYRWKVTQQKCKYSYGYLYKIRNMILPEINYNGICDLSVNIKENIVEIGVRNNDMVDSNIKKLTELLKNQDDYHQDAVKIQKTNSYWYSA